MYWILLQITYRKEKQMFYLFLAILCSASIALLFKYSESNKLNRYALTSINYVAAFSVSLIMVIIKSPYSKLSGNISLVSFKEEFISVVIGNSGTFSNNSSFIWALLLGFTTGIFYFLSFIFYQKSVKENGASLSGIFSRLGMIIPMLISIMIWREFPSSLQWAGIGLALIAIIILNMNFSKESYSKISFTLILLFIFGGMGDFQNKFFQKYAILSYKDLFLFAVFFTAFVLSSILTFRLNRSISKKDIIMGIMVGIPNLFSSYFLLLALNTIPTSLAFPIFSAGSIIFITIGSFILYKEKLQNKDKVAMLFVVLALVLMNI